VKIKTKRGERKRKNIKRRKKEFLNCVLLNLMRKYFSYYDVITWWRHNIQKETREVVNIAKKKNIIMREIKTIKIKREVLHKKKKCLKDNPFCRDPSNKEWGFLYNKGESCTPISRGFPLFSQGSHEPPSPFFTWCR